MIHKVMTTMELISDHNYHWILCLYFSLFSVVLPLIEKIYLYQELKSVFDHISKYCICNSLCFENNIMVKHGLPCLIYMNYITDITNCLCKYPTEIIMYLLLSTSLEELWFVDPFLFPWSLFLSKSVNKYINISHSNPASVPKRWLENLYYI